MERPVYSHQRWFRKSTIHRAMRSRPTRHGVDGDSEFIPHRWIFLKRTRSRRETNAVTMSTGVAIVRGTSHHLVLRGKIAVSWRMEHSN